MASYTYFVHWIRRLQDNNSDALMAVTGDKGTGKSTAAIDMTIEYIRLFGFICPKCGVDFYKNVYALDDTGDRPRFYVPDYVKDDRAWIQCPQEFTLNSKTKEKRLVRGCGHLFKYSQRRYPKFSAEKYIAYDNKDMFNKIFNASKCSPIIADEAVKFAAGMYHNKADSKQLKELFTMVRPKQFWFFFCIPEFQWLDTKYREHMSSFWLRMIERGVGIMFEKDKGEAPEKYHLKKMQELMGTVKYFTPMEKIKRNLKRHPCFFDMLRFPELNEKVYNDYEMVRNSINLQRQVEEMEITNKDMAKVMSYNLLKKWDRIKVAVERSKDYRLTYKVLLDEILVNPLTREHLVSDVTVRNWLRGIENYLSTGGKNLKGFDGNLEI